MVFKFYFTLFVFVLITNLTFASELVVTKPDIQNYMNILPSVIDKIAVINKFPDNKKQQSSLIYHNLRQILKKKGFRSLADFFEIHNNMMKSVAYWKMKRAVVAMKNNIKKAPAASKALMNMSLNNTEKQVLELQKELDQNLLKNVKPHVDSIAQLVNHKQ